MSELDTYLEKARAQLRAADYKTYRGARASCWGIALQVSRLVEAKGIRPVVFEVAKMVGGQMVEMTPLLYEGRVTLYGHVACSAEGLMLDPLLDEPEPIETYGVSAFGEALTLRVITADKWAEVTPQIEGTAPPLIPSS